MSKRILIVEDEAINALFMKYVLLQNNHEVIGIVNNGKDAVKVAIEQKPDLIIMDIKLIGSMNGIDAMKEIQRTGEIEHFYATAYNDAGIIRKAQETNPREIFFKPLDIDDFLKKIWL